MGHTDHFTTTDTDQYWNPLFSTTRDTSQCVTPRSTPLCPVETPASSSGPRLGRTGTGRQGCGVHWRAEGTSGQPRWDRSTGTRVGWGGAEFYQCLGLRDCLSDGQRLNKVTMKDGSPYRKTSLRNSPKSPCVSPWKRDPGEGSVLQNYPENGRTDLPLTRYIVQRKAEPRAYESLV